MEWKPIETAPKDVATPVLVYCRDALGEHQAVSVWINWESGKSYWCIRVGDGLTALRGHPTHWMLLPASPKGAA